MLRPTAAGLYAARTARLLELAEAAKSSGEAKVAEEADGVRLVPDLEGIHTLSLSADELLLAVGAKGAICIYSTQDLMEKVSAVRGSFWWFAVNLCIQ